MTSTATEIQTTQVYMILIKATQDAVWEAITEPAFVAQYFHNARLEVELRPGGMYRSTSPDGSELWVEAEVIEVEPPRRFVHGWRSLYNPELATFEADRVYNQKDAEGFIRLNALRLRIGTKART